VVKGCLPPQLLCFLVFKIFLEKLTALSVAGVVSCLPPRLLSFLVDFLKKLAALSVTWLGFYSTSPATLFPCICLPKKLIVRNVS
jgi:hypothetical protein